MKTLNIRPSDIDPHRPFDGAFGNVAAEETARQIIRLCRQRNSWMPFFRTQVEPMAPGIMPFLKKTDDVYSVTDDFIVRCYGVAPSVQ